MNKVLKIIITIVLCLLIGYLTKCVQIRIEAKHYDDIESLYNIKIDTEFINVRSGHTVVSDLIYQVLEDEEYEVIELYNYDTKYMWYKIKFSYRREGWIASSREEAWIEVLE
jgi:uncharacterized protein YgiM (DUF1202 family)